MDSKARVLVKENRSEITKAPWLNGNSARVHLWRSDPKAPKAEFHVNYELWKCELNEGTL